MKKINIFIILSLVLCMGTTAFAGAYTPGTYEGTGDGRNGEIKVAVTLDDKSIIDIQVTQEEETEGFGEKAYEGMTKAILDGQTLKVDAISGATLSSNGFVVAVANALTAAEIDPKELGYIPPALPDPSEQIKETGANKEGVRNFEYITQGNTCSTKITFVINEEALSVSDLVIYDGCDGNARGFSALAEEEAIDTIIERFAGISCHASDGSSCPDQVAKALNEARFILVGERLAISQ